MPSTASSGTSKTTRTEKIYVLYGSQTGNSEQAAKDLCQQIPIHLSSQQIQKLTGCKDLIAVDPTHMQLDDFLELEQAAWTRLVVIICSSYGVGQAPLGGYRFRDLCDAWLEQVDEYKQNLDGVYFALCGLGDSKFTTFFQNPTRINEAMLKVGAQRAGPIGKADASGKGNDSQQLVIERWMQGIWKHLAEVVAKEPLEEDKLKEMQEQTIDICRKINPEFLPSKKSSPVLSPMLLLAVLVALGAVAAYIFLNNVQQA